MGSFFFFSLLRWASCSVVDLEVHVLIVDCLVVIFLCHPLACDSPAIWRVYCRWCTLGLYFYEVDFNGELFHTHDGMSFLLFCSAGPAFCFTVRMEYIHINNGKTYLRLLFIIFVKKKS